MDKNRRSKKPSILAFPLLWVTSRAEDKGTKQWKEI